MLGYMVSQAIAAVTDLGVADRVADGPATARELADAAGGAPAALRRFLRALASEGLFAEDPQGRFRLTPMGSLLRGDLPGSLRPFVQLMTAEAYEAWGDALYSVRTGNPAFERVFGAPLFGWLPGHPSASARFDAGQAGLVPLRMEPLLDRDWAGVSTVVDVGGGNGALLAGLIGRNPHLKGILFDLPHVANAAERAVASAGLGARVRWVGGDFRPGVPAGGDVY